MRKSMIILILLAPTLLQAKDVYKTDNGKVLSKIEALKLKITKPEARVMKCYEVELNKNARLVKAK